MKVINLSLCCLFLLVLTISCSREAFPQPAESTCFEDQGADFGATAHLNDEPWLAEHANYFQVAENEHWIRLKKAFPDDVNSMLQIGFTGIDINRRDTIMLSNDWGINVSLAEIVGCDAIAGTDTLYSPTFFQNWMIIEEVSNDRLVATFQVALKRNRDSYLGRPDENFFTSGRIVAKRREP